MDPELERELTRYLEEASTPYDASRAAEEVYNQVSAANERERLRQVAGLPPMSVSPAFEVGLQENRLRDIAQQHAEEQELRNREEAAQRAYDRLRPLTTGEGLGAPVGFGVPAEQPAEQPAGPQFPSPAEYARPDLDFATTLLNEAARQALRGRTVGGSSWREVTTETRGGDIDPDLAARLRRYDETIPAMVEDIGRTQGAFLQAQADVAEPALEENLRQLQADEAERQRQLDAVRAQMARVRDAVDQAGAGRINPIPEGLGGHIAGALSVGLAQLAGGTAMAESVQAQINRAIERAIMAQVENQHILERYATNQFRLLDYMRQEFRDEMAAREAYRAALYANAATRVQVLGMRAAGEKVKQEALLLAEQLRQQRDQALAAAQAAAVQTVRTTTTTPVRRAGPDPRLLVQVANAARQVGDTRGETLSNTLAEERQRMAQRSAQGHVPPLGYVPLGPEGAARYASLSPEQRTRVDEGLAALDNLRTNLRQLAQWADETSMLGRLDPAKRARARQLRDQMVVDFNKLAGLGALAGADVDILTSVVSGDIGDILQLQGGGDRLRNLERDLVNRASVHYRMAGVAPEDSPEARNFNLTTLRPR